MSSSTFINPFLYVECASVEQADDLDPVCNWSESAH